MAKQTFWLAAPLVLSSSLSQAANTEEELAAIYQQVFGNTAAKLPTELETEFSVNGQGGGSIRALTDQTQLTRLQREVLLPRLQPYLKESLYQQLEQQSQGQIWLNLSTLESVGVKARYNLMELKIDIKINSKSLNRRMRSLLNLGGRQNVIPERLAEPAKLSGHINFYGALQHEFDAPAQATRQQIRLETAFNAQGYVFENLFTYDSRLETGLRREQSRLVIDDAEAERRYQIGDISSSGRNFQSSLSLGGVQVLHDLMWASGQTYTPQGNHRFTLSNDAEVEVWQDGSLKRTLKLKAGDYDMRAIDALGSNQVKLKITDAFGKVSIQTFSHFTDSRLLHPDISRYAISVGFPAAQRSQERSYDTQRKIVSAYYQQGITEQLTAGVDAQTDGKHHQLGADVIWATALGNINAGLSHTSRPDGKAGQAARLQISARPVSPLDAANPAPINWDFSLEAYSSHYQALSESAWLGTSGSATQALHYQASLSLSKSFTEKINANVNLSQRHYHDGKQAAYLSANVYAQINPYLQASVYANTQTSQQQTHDFGLRVGFSLPLASQAGKRSQQLDGNYDSGSQTSRLGYRLGSAGQWGKNSLQGSLQLEQNAKNIQTISGSGSYQDPRFSLAGSVQQQHSQATQRSSGSLNLNTALVFADGAVALSRPVTDSFVILEAPPDLQQAMAVSRGKSLFQRQDTDPNGLPEHYDALIQPQQTAVLNQLNAYQVQHVSTDALVLPEGFDLSATEFDFLPDYKTGYRVKVGGERGSMLEAHLSDAQGQALALQGGKLHALTSSQAPITFFTDEAGVMRLSSIRQGAYRIELFSLPNLHNLKIQVTGKPGETQTLAVRAHS